MNKKVIIFVALMMIAVMSIGTQIVYAAGASSCDTNDPLAKSVYTNSSWETVDAASGKKAIKILDSKYANRLAKTSDSTCAVTSGTHKGENVESYDFRKDGESPLGKGNSYIFDLRNNTHGNIILKYENYNYTDPSSGLNRKVDVVLTVNSWNVKDCPLTTYSVDYPILAISKNLYGGVPAVDIVNVGQVRIDLEFYDHGSRSPVSLASNVTFNDVDHCQAVSIKAGNVEEVYVTKDCVLKTNNDDDNWITLFDYTASDAAMKDSPENCFSAAYEGKGLQFVFTSDMIKYSKGSSGDEIPNIGTSAGARSYFGTSNFPLVLNEPPHPTKSVRDNDDAVRSGNGIIKGDESTYTVDTGGNDAIRQINTITSKDKKWVYRIRQDIPNGYTSDDAMGTIFSKFIITDTLDSCIEPVMDSVLIRSSADGGTDITNYFTIKYENNTITATANSALLKNDDLLYGNGGGRTIQMYFTAKIKDSISYDDLISHGHMENGTMFVKVENQAGTIIIPKARPDITWEKKTGKTTTNIVIPKPEKNAPAKEVSDDDNIKLNGTGSEKNVTENTIEYPDEVYTYHIKHKIGSGYIPTWYFKSYKITDKVEELLLVQDGARVYAGSTDVTSKFDINVSDDKQTITATAKTAELAKADFYNKTYELRFKVKIDTDKYYYESDLKKWHTANTKGENSILIKWPNKAKVDITDNIDPYYPDTEDGKGTWGKETNTVNTNLWIPTGEGSKKPGLVITKNAEPYEFQVNKAIPYTITINQTNKDAVAYLVKAEDTNLPKGFKIDAGSIKATGGTEPKAWVEGDNTLKITAKYLKYGETLTVTFNGHADKTLNGTVVPNEVRGRAWGTHEEDKSTWDNDHTSVYINSPKVNITKSVSKESRLEEGESADYKTGETLKFTSVITNENPGTFMRNIYVLDTAETQGLEFLPSSLKIQYNSGTDEDRMVSLKEGRDYEIEFFSDGSDIVPLDNLGSKVGSKDVDDYKIETATEAENARAKGTGAVKPTDTHGGFYIRFLGKYRNLGYQDKTVPATNDERCKTVKYLADALKAIEAREGVNYTTDYENLNLQNKIVITYNMTIEDEKLVNKGISNFIKVPATENTNNDIIADDDSIPSGGDFARWTTIIEAQGKPTKEVSPKELQMGNTLGAKLTYTITAENTGEEKIIDPFVEDEVDTKNIKYNKDLRLYKDFVSDANEITDKAEIKYEDNNYSFTVKGFTLKPGEQIVGVYTADVTNELDVTEGEDNYTADTSVKNTLTFLGKKAISLVKVVEKPKDMNVTVTKESDPPSGSLVKDKDDITYILTATNTGNDVVPYTHIRDVIPEGTSFKEVFDDGVYVEDKGCCEWVIGELNTGESRQVKFTVTVNEDPPREIRNVATYKPHYEDPGKPGEIEDEPDRKTEETVHYTSEDHDAHTLLRAVKFSDPETGCIVKAGDEITYHIELENYGDADTETAVIRDHIPEGTEFVKADDNGKFNAQKGYIDWYPLAIKSGEKAMVSFTVKVTEKATEKMVIKNQALYQENWDEDPGKEPSNSTNIIEHTLKEKEKENEKPNDNNKGTDDPNTNDQKEDEPETEAEDMNDDSNAMKHVKSVQETETSKGKILHYSLDTEIITDVGNVIITDEVTSKNLNYIKKSIRAYYNDKEITNDIDLSISDNSFDIITGINAEKGDKFKVTYEATAQNDKKVKNISTAYADNVDPVESNATVEPENKTLSDKKKTAEDKSDSDKKTSSAKTGDVFSLEIASWVMILAAGALMISLFRRKKLK